MQLKLLPIPMALVLLTTSLLTTSAFAEELTKVGVLHSLPGTMVISTTTRKDTILLVEQKLKFVRAVADCFAILDRGRAVATGPIENLNEGLIKEYLTV